MKDKRREFIKKSASLAAAVSLGSIHSMAHHTDLIKKNNETRHTLNGYAKDAGMEMSEAFFFGMEERKVALMKQMNVFGAVGGINTRMVGLSDVKPWEARAVIAVKEAWEK